MYVGRSTVDRELAALKTILRLGDRNGKVYKVPYVPLFNEKNPKGRIVKLDEFSKLVDKLPEHLKLLARFLYATGFRSNEALNLKYSQIDFRNKLLKLAPTSTKEKQLREVHLTDEILDVLKDCKARKKKLRYFGDYVFISRIGNTNLKFFEGNNRMAWNKACREAELGYGYKLGGANSKYQKKFIGEIGRASCRERV